MEDHLQKGNVGSNPTDGFNAAIGLMVIHPSFGGGSNPHDNTVVCMSTYG